MFDPVIIPKFTRARLDFKAPPNSRWIHLKDLTADQKQVMVNFRRAGFTSAVISYLTFTDEYRKKYTVSLNYCLQNFNDFTNRDIRTSVISDLLQCPEVPDSVKINIIRTMSFGSTNAYMRHVRFTNTEESMHLLCDIMPEKMASSALANMNLLLADIVQKYRKTILHDGYRVPRNYQCPNQIRFWVGMYLLDPKVSSRYLDVFPWGIFNNGRPRASNVHDMLVVLNATLPFNPSAIKIFKNESVLKALWSEAFGLEAVRKSGSAIAHIPLELRTQAICDAAVSNTPSAQKYVPRDKYNKAVILKQALQSDTILKYAR